MARSVVVLVGLLVAAGIFVVRQMFFRPTTITAYFTTATAIYPGDDVRVVRREGRHDRVDRTGRAPRRR